MAKRIFFGLFFRYSITNMNTQKNYSNSKSGLMVQQLVSNQNHNQFTHYNHHNNQHSYDDKVMPLINQIKNKKNQSHQTDHNFNNNNSVHLNSENTSSDLTSLTSSLSTSISAQNNNNINDMKSINTNSNQNLIVKNNNLNNNSNDWNKVKRRPMVMDNQMEQELTKQIDILSADKNVDIIKCDEIHATQSHSIECGSMKSDLQTSKCEAKENERAKSDLKEDVNHQEQIEQTGFEPDEVESQEETSISCESSSTQQKAPEILSPSAKHCVGGIKRTKGNLKSQHSAATKANQSCSAGSVTGSFGSNTTSRRVSFDPLALLLDAALEGELELVKKTAKEVCDVQLIERVSLEFGNKFYCIFRCQIQVRQMMKASQHCTTQFALDTLTS